LARPPFRFLHDVVTQLMKKTGFFTGLFPQELMEAKTLTDKKDKLKAWEIN
jgi:TRAF3-interacting protein 1